MNSAIPEKKYFKIGETSGITGLEPHVLRFWESEFKSLSPKKDGGKQRLYTKKDIETILKIKKLLYDENYTIAGARKVIEVSKPGRKEKKVANTDEELKVKLKEIKRELEIIRDML